VCDFPNCDACSIHAFGHLVCSKCEQGYYLEYGNGECERKNVWFNN